MPLVRSTHRYPRPVGTRLFHFVDGEERNGMAPDMFGDPAGLWGDCTGMKGNCTGLRGDLSPLSADNRKAQPYVELWARCEEAADVPMAKAA
jgi:hypothetical protein